MGGWAVILGTPDNLAVRLDRFKRVFSAPGVPALHMDTRTFPNNWHIVAWAWAEPPVPDLFVVTSEDPLRTLVLDGYITQIDQNSYTFEEQEQAANTILERWPAGGLRSIRTINGSFSCAFLDTSKCNLTLVTDRFASRAVWYTRERTVWMAGNYPAALAALFERNPRLHTTGLWSLFAGGRHVGPHGLYDGMTNVQAGEYAVLEKSTSSPRRTGRWIDKRYEPEWGLSPRVWSRRLTDRLYTASKRLLNVTPAPHLFLSGGLDSRIAAAALGEPSTNVTLTSSTNNMNARIAKSVSNLTGATHRTLQRGPYWYLDTFQAAALVSGGNYNLRNAHFMVPVQQTRSVSPKAAFLLGDLLENFNKHYFKPIPSIDAGSVAEEMPRFYHSLYSYTHPEPQRLRRLFQQNLVDRLYNDWKEALMRLWTTIVDTSDDPRDRLDVLFRWVNCGLCPTYLMFECIRPMASERNLMFDNDLLDLLIRIPSDVRGAERLHPWTLWHLNKKLALVPDSNYWLPPILPGSVKKLTKKVRPRIGHVRRALKARSQQGPVIKTEGSWHMLFEWYRKDNKHRDFIDSCLNDLDCFPTDIFRKEAILATWNEFLNDPGSKAAAFELDMLLTFGLLNRQIPSAGIQGF